MGGISVGPGEGGGEAWDDGGELFGVDAGDAVELFGEDGADGGLVLFGSVLEHGDVMAREAEAALGGAARRAGARDRRRRRGLLE